MMIFVRDMRERGKCTTTPHLPHGATRAINEMLYGTEFPSVKIEESEDGMVISVYSEYTEDPTNFLPEELLTTTKG